MADTSITNESKIFNIVAVALSYLVMSILGTLVLSCNGAICTQFKLLHSVANWWLILSFVIYIGLTFIQFQTHHYLRPFIKLFKLPPIVIGLFWILIFLGMVLQ